MTTSARTACALLGLLMGIAPAMAGEEGIEAKAAFALLKSLKGEWKATGQDGHSNLKVIYQVTAAGSTVMQTQHAGTSHEMVTMYHLDGKDLKATHYCAAGNQPHLKLDLKNSKPDELSFVFDGGTNLDPAKDMHIHSLRIKVLEAGKIEEEWEGYMDGKKGESTKFPLTRM